jgi:hypothetical protein
MFFYGDDGHGIASGISAGEARVALAGETVIMKSREGNLRLSLDAPATGSLIGCMRGLLAGTDDDIDGPTSDAGSWDSDLCC